MPIHHRVGYEVARRVVPYARGLVNSERMVLNQAWKGYKHKSRIVTGLRGSLVAGGIAGGLIRDSDNPEMDAQVPFFPKTSKPYQARRGRGRYSGRYSKRRCRPCRNGRRSSNYRGKSSRNRF